VGGGAWGPITRATGACAHSPVHGESGEGGTDKAGPWRKDQKGDARGQRLGTGEPGRRDRERGSARVKETGTDRSAPLGSKREREGACERGLPLTGRVRLSGGAGARPG
jgi:hypothetical protein